MVRRLLHLLALLALVLSGPAQGLLVAAAPAASCCCGGSAEDPSPCGMPKGPCAPRCPTGPSQSAPAAPAALVSRARAAQVRKAAPRKEPAPWPAFAAQTRVRRAFLEAAPSHAPPLPPRRDPQAKLSQFRI